MLRYPSKNWAFPFTMWNQQVQKQPLLPFGLRVASATLVVILILLSPQHGNGQQPPKHTNRLAKESSPYLLQHAHNPVDWYPWGEEAIAKARRENKMIFLSVGYAACHWCHVMEHESFEDEEIADFMNQRFVCIKVDREERPDVDQIYMTAVQMISGNGGWPMSVFLLPDTRPFWGGTYFPARTGDRGRATGFLSIIKQIDKAWQTQPDTVAKQAEHVTDALRRNQQIQTEQVQTEGTSLSAALVNRVANELKSQFDPKFGGFGYSDGDPNRPKFPEPSNLVFLLDRMNRESVDPEDQQTAREMLEKTLDGMISGSMIDHLGGGFHRYSVDRSWQIPHFEKMLYDNGQLASVFANAGERFDREEYREVARGICDFVLRELRDDGGAFYSSLDADSEGEEGKFYRWDKSELEVAAGELNDYEFFANVFRLDAEPNFEETFFALDPRRTLTAVAKEKNLSFGDLNLRLNKTRAWMFQYRAKRERPRTDVKILTAWNGLMIAGLADAGRILDDEKYIKAAKDAADFVLAKLASDDRRLKRSYADGTAKLNAYLDDYAFLANALIALHRATNDPKWLDEAKAITDKQIELFLDKRSGGFYFTSSDHASLIVRTKNPIDSALPSGNSVAAENLLYLSRRFPSSAYENHLKETFRSVVPMFRNAPAGVPRIAACLAEQLDRMNRSQSAQK